MLLDDDHVKSRAGDNNMPAPKKNLVPRLNCYAVWENRFGGFMRRSLYVRGLVVRGSSLLVVRGQGGCC